MTIRIECSQCGKTIEMDNTREFIFCRSCGAKNMKPQQENPSPYEQAPVMNAPQVQNMPHQNLIISYYSINPAVTMMTNFVYNNCRTYYQSGACYSFDMPYGIQRIIFRIGNRNYARNISLYDNNAPVKIYASWNGRARIQIEQPPMPQPSFNAVPAPSYNAAPTCRYCGRALRYDEVFCPGCGKPRG